MNALRRGKSCHVSVDFIFPGREHFSHIIPSSADARNDHRGATPKSLRHSCLPQSIHPATPVVSLWDHQGVHPSLQEAGCGCGYGEGLGKVQAGRDCRRQSPVWSSQVKPSLQQGTLATSVLKWKGWESTVSRDGCSCISGRERQTTQKPSRTSESRTKGAEPAEAERGPYGQAGHRAVAT